MFNRKVLKARAKQVLSTTYWQSLLMIFIISLITSIAGSIFSVRVSGGLFSFGAQASFARSILLNGVVIFMLFISIAISVFFLNPLSLGLNKFMLDAAKHRFTDIGAIGYSFRSNYKNIVLVTFMKSLILFLFAVIPVILLIFSSVYFSYGGYNSGYYIDFVLSRIPVIVPSVSMLLGYLLLIPLIMKSYDYYLVEYILADNAGIGWRDALRKSKQLMRGNRFAAFVMNLSFIGWLLLGLCACGIGTFFVSPYIQATNTQLYLELSGQSDVYTPDDGSGSAENFNM